LADFEVPYELFWGETHTNLHSRHLGQVEDILQRASKFLDFCALAYYPQGFRSVRGFRFEDWIDEDRVEREWRQVCSAVRKRNEPGKFVVFAGWEWQGDGRWGDHNVFYLDDDPPLIRVNSLPELYDEIRRRRLKALAIPHHTAYMVGIRGKNWDCHDEDLSPFAEIFSQHGSSESDEGPIGLRSNRHMGPEVSGGTIEEGLERGYRLGIICSTDNHEGFVGYYGHGLMGSWASSLTRQGLWESFRNRRVYGVSGDRIRLWLSAAGAPMGSRVDNKGPLEISVMVRGCDALDRIELLRNNALIAGYFHRPRRPSGGEPAIFKLRIEVGWGPDQKEALGLGPRDWHGSLALQEGEILSVEPCWRGPGQWVDEPGGRSLDFGFRTWPPMGATAVTQALIFEIRLRPSDRARLSIDGKTVDFSMEDAMQRSQVLFFPEESKERIRLASGLDPASLPRDDPFYFLSHKAKIHRAVPEEAYSAVWRYVDSSPPRGLNHYRVRVHQRNGQKAWSSPIWVDNS